MQGVGWIGAIIIGAFAGWVAERITSAKHGLITNIFLGILGAVVFNAVMALVGVSLAGWIGQFIAGALGASLLIWGWRALRGGRS